MAQFRSSMNTVSLSWGKKLCLQSLSLQKLLGKIQNKWICIFWSPTQHFPFRVNVTFSIECTLHNLQWFFLDKFDHSLGISTNLFRNV